MPGGMQYQLSSIAVPLGTRKGCEIRFIACPDRVREVLGKVTAQLDALGCMSDDIANIELVLAEVLNNIVEHAYGMQTLGPIVLRLRLEQDTLHCTVVDEGGEMPGGALPGGDCPAVNATLDMLPEGGFGWFVIRNYVRDLEYMRTDGRNRVSFRLACKIGQVS